MRERKKGGEGEREKKEMGRERKRGGEREERDGERQKECKRKRVFHYSSFMRMRSANFDDNSCVTQLK